MFRRVYLDNAATTKVDERVFEAMRPSLTDQFGNPSSIHAFGQEAKMAVDRARHQIAEILHAAPNEITFTSGGTESNNLAIRGICQRHSPGGGHIIISAIEHPAVKAPAEALQDLGFEISKAGAGTNGRVDPSEIAELIRPDTVLISVMLANNEIGTLQPLREIAGLVSKERASRENRQKIFLHTDAVQALGKIPIDVLELGCDLLTISAHKIYAPKGVGVLWAKRGVRLAAQNLGGNQERGFRGGTENVPGIVAFGKACELAASSIETETTEILGLRTRFESAVLERIPGSSINGDSEARIPNISNIAFENVDGEGLLINLDMQGIAVSTGSACSSGSIEASPVLLALGQDEKRARSAIRFSFGRFNTSEDVDYVLERLPGAIETLRKLA